MKIINSEPILNFINHGFIYLCVADDGSYWIRSVAGKWAKLTAKPMDFASLEEDFNNFVKNKTATEVEVKADNTDQIVIEPIKKIIPPAPIIIDEMLTKKPSDLLENEKSSKI